MSIQNSTVSHTTAATTTSYAQLEAAATADQPRTYLRVENTHASDILVLGVGASTAEVAIATIPAKGVFELKPILVNKNDGFNPVPQGRLAIKSAANTPTYNATTAKVDAIVLK